MGMNIEPIGDLGRPAEHGRIRTGVTTAKGAPKSLKTWRFTSTDGDAIRALAELYGGEASPWHNTKANPPDQWEVITEADEIEVLLPPGCLYQAYELWDGKGCMRRCDGVTAMLPDSESGWHSVTCVCEEQGFRECLPKTRLSVYLPTIAFAGSWRLESSSDNVLHEFKGMVNALSSIQAMHMHIDRNASLVRCFLRLVPQKRIVRGKTRHFVLPKFRLDTSIDALASGGAIAELRMEPEALPSAQDSSDAPEPSVLDNDVVDAEIVVEDELEGVPRVWRKEEIPEGAKFRKVRGKDLYQEIVDDKGSS